MNARPTCWSCQHSSYNGCLLQRPEFETLTPCESFCYEPGSDEDEADNSEVSGAGTAPAGLPG